MDLSTTATAELITIAKRKVQGGEFVEDLLNELGARYAYKDSPGEDKAMIVEFDRSILIPVFGCTRLPPQVIHLLGAKMPPIPAYYKQAGANRSGTAMNKPPRASFSLQRKANNAAEFFISYSGKDMDTARYLRQWLEEAGYSTFMQEPDFPPTSHIVEKMEEGMNAARLLVILSGNYLNSDYCQAECQAAFMRDPLNKDARIVIVRIAECHVPVLWAPISRIELLGAGSHIRELFLKKIAELPRVRVKRKPRRKMVASVLPSHPTVQSHGGVSAQASGAGGIAAAAGGDLHFHYGERKRPRSLPKAPPDVITEGQAIKLKQLMVEVIELDSGSPEGKKLSEGQLRQKWWGALGKKVPGTSYTNHSQAKYKRAMQWLREHRARLVSGAAETESALAAGAMIRAIHTHISRNNLNKRACYEDWSNRLGISPPFESTKDLSLVDLERIYRATRRDARAKGST